MYPKYALNSASEAEGSAEKSDCAFSGLVVYKYSTTVMTITCRIILVTTTLVLMAITIPSKTLANS